MTQIRAKVGIVPVGCPGSGKGTQGKEIAKRFGGIHFSMGDTIGGDQVWPEEWALQPLCDQVKSYRRDGVLAPDAVICQLFERAFIKIVQSATLFVIDGFPRTPAQVNFFSSTVSRILGKDLPIYVVELVVSLQDEDEILQRVIKRARTDGGKVKHLVRMHEHKTVVVRAIEHLKSDDRFTKLKRPVNALLPEGQITEHIIRKIGLGRWQLAVS